MCMSYVSNNTGAVLVFDGYDGFSTKDEVHNRRMENYVGAPVSVSQYMANVDITVQQKVIQITRYVLWPAGQHKLNQQVLLQTIQIFFQLLIHHADL